MMARQWFSMYAADLLVDKDVALLSDKQFRFLVKCWCRCCLDGSIPTGASDLAAIMQITQKTAEKHLEFLPNFFQISLDKPDEFFSERMRKDAQAYEVKVEKLRDNGSKGGRPPKAIGFPENKQLPLELQLQLQLQKDKEITTTPAKPERKARTPKVGIQTLEEILQGGQGSPMWESYWRIVSTFGGQGKNPAPKTTAKLYADAIAAGTDPARIQFQAQAIRNATSEVKYMPQLAKWLEGQGYLTPDIPKSTGATHGTSHSPSHRAGIDAAYLEQVNARIASATPQPELSDEEMFSLYGHSA